jgi:hypothetical protein
VSDWSYVSIKERTYGGRYQWVDTSPTLTVRRLFNALHSEWRLLCNSEVHEPRVVAAEGLSVASVARYFASPGASIARVTSPPSSVARVVMLSPVAPQTVGSNWSRQKVARSPGVKLLCGRIPTNYLACQDELFVLAINPTLVISHLKHTSCSFVGYIVKLHERM